MSNVEERAVQRVARKIGEKLTAEWVTRSDLRRRLTSGDRSWFEDAVDRLVSAGQIEAKETERGVSYKRRPDDPGRQLGHHATGSELLSMSVSVTYTDDSVGVFEQADTYVIDEHGHLHLRNRFKRIIASVPAGGFKLVQTGARQTERVST
jgi:hypothetical protein